MGQRLCAFSQVAGTYSIVARDAETGQLGVAVQSHWFSVGSVVPWAEAGIGAVATQSVVEVSYGPLGLERMRGGMAAPRALAELLMSDPGRELRQVAMVDGQGEVAAHTGARCISEAGHEVGQAFSVQANMMARRTVWPAMACAYQEARGDLADRLLAALDAAQAEGGDIRGMQSAALLIVEGERKQRPWEGVLIELRVEDHPEPLKELRRLLALHRAYEHMNEGDALLGKNRVEAALQQYRKAAEMVPHIAELPFWQAVTLADLGELEAALPLFRDVFRRDPSLVTLVRRLPAAGLLRDDASMIQRILSVTE